MPAAGRLKTWAGRIRARLAPAFGRKPDISIEISPEISVARRYLDSFDWRLLKRGAHLLAEYRPGRDSEKINLRWLAADNNPACSAVLTLAALPVRAEDLPAGEVRDRLSAMLGIRALLPVARILSRQIRLSVKDGQGKTRCCLILEQNQAETAAGRARPLGRRLSVEPLTGYEKDHARIVRRLKKMAGLEPGGVDLFARAASALGHEPGGGRARPRLRRGWRVDKGCRTLLLGELGQIEKNIEGALADIDTEFLHDLRVSIRRSRSLLNKMKAAFPPTVWQRYARELAWLGGVTTPRRDLDVYMLAFPKYRLCLPEAQRADLAPFYDFLRGRRQAEQALLIKYLGSARFDRFRRAWRRYLERPLPARPRALLATRPIGPVADRAIWRAYRKLIKEGAGVSPQSADAAIHKLRKTGKKLRYLLEFFASLYPQKQTRTIIKALKGLQENLGEFQDLSVQARTLRDFRQALSGQGAGGPETGRAMQALIDALVKKKRAVRREFSGRFRRFASSRIEREFSNLCGRGKKAARKKAARGKRPRQ